MGVYGWERGTIVLPSAEFAAFRQKMQDAEQAEKQQIFDLTQECWQGLSRKQQTDPAHYHDAVRAFMDNQADAEVLGSARGSGMWRVGTPRWTRGALDEAEDLMQRQTWSPTGHGQDQKPRRVLKGDVDWPTNRSTAFTGPECSVTFDRDKRTVTWESSGKFMSDNRPEGAYSDLGNTFFAHLDTVRWTHGTGGVIQGSNDMRYHEGAGPGVESAHGYLGIEQAPRHVKPFTNAKGERIGAQVVQGRTGVTGKPVKVDPYGRPLAPRSRPAAGGQGRVARGVPTGGQFSTRGRGESGVSL